MSAPDLSHAELTSTGVEQASATRGPALLFWAQVVGNSGLFVGMLLVTRALGPSGRGTVAFLTVTALITASGSLVEYGGIPMNEAGRLYALAWSAARIQGRQHQCMGYVVPYTYNAPGNFRFWEERDPYTQRLLAIKSYWQEPAGLRLRTAMARR